MFEHLDRGDTMSVDLRIHEPRVISGLRAIHTGSANDYPGYAIAGTLAVITVLGLG